jgi:hypothetical protein
VVLSVTVVPGVNDRHLWDMILCRRSAIDRRELQSIVLSGATRPPSTAAGSGSRPGISCGSSRRRARGACARAT